LRLVVNDPSGAVDKLEAEKKIGEAAQKAQELADQVASLENQFAPKAGEYKNGNVHQEMAARILVASTASASPYSFIGWSSLLCISQPPPMWIQHVIGVH
jgi:hypothetical protein